MKLEVLMYAQHLGLLVDDNAAPDWADLATTILAGLSSEYPQAEIEVEVREHVSGAGSYIRALDDEGNLLDRESMRLDTRVNKILSTWLERGES